ncbi:hypothetical protein CIB48_g5562 [Xylaria polymorpha]|nr:hypothetical protein CIB48_g5562 [Xylaria polymorpha]
MPYFTSVTSKRALTSPLRLNQLPKRLPAASSWDTNELFAFRVVVEAANTRILPYLAEESVSSHALISSNTALLELVQPAPPDLPMRVETDLAIICGPTLAQFWAALADVVAGGQEQDFLDSEDDHVTEGGRIEGEDIASSPEQPPSKRARKTVELPGMVDSTQAQFASSSPHQPSSQVSSKDDAFMPPDDGLDATREIKTERLVTCFLRHILYYVPYKELELRNRLECRTRLSVGVSTEGGWFIRAEDDGGLRLRLRLRSFLRDGEYAYNHPQLRDSYYVLFEAKRRFQHICEGRPTISDAWLGQMTAEALAGRLARKPHYTDPK